MLTRNHSVSTLRPRAACLAAATVTILLAAAPAQTIGEGYSETLEPLSPQASSIAVLPHGIAWFDGQQLILEEAGQPQRTLLQFAQPRFAAFTRIVDHGAALVFAESSFGELWLVPLSAAAPTLLTTLTLPYDATLIGPDRILVSAKTGGFSSPDNDLIAVDLHTGAPTQVATVPGASGPLVAGQSGDVFYATAPLAFPPPPGGVDVLRFSAAQWARPLAGGAPLISAEAEVVFAGIDAAGSLALDSDRDLLFVDWLNGSIDELNDIDGTPWRTDLLDYAGGAASPSALQFLPPRTQAAFEPFAFGHGAELVIHETDFAAVNRLRRVAPAPAELIAGPGPVPAGPFGLTLQHAASNGMALISLGAASAGVAVPITVPGIEQVLLWDAAMLTPTSTFLVAIDASGAVVLPLTNPGFPQGLQVWSQTAFLDATGTVLGGTQPLRIGLGN